MKIVGFYTQKLIIAIFYMKLRHFGGNNYGILGMKINPWNFYHENHRILTMKNIAFWA